VNIPTTIDPTSVDSIMSTMLTVFPNAQIGEDTNQQIIIYTGLYQVGDSSVPLAQEDEIAFDERGDRKKED
tara:strand:- start:2961 stop:3173 length:213 start_codon:yes stop_codon:yes gene_type:complete